MKARTTTVTKAAIAASRKYPEKNIWYFCKGSNECFVIGGNNVDALHKAGFHSFAGVEHRHYINGRKQG